MIKNFIFLGAPGVGKGTMAALVAKEKGMKHISTGDMFRNHIKNETEIGKRVKSILDSGGYVSDDIVNEMVKVTLEENKDQGVILDGYPRTPNQAEFLEKINFDLSAAVLLDADDSIVKERLLSRAKKENRADDTPEVIADRIKIYNEKTAPLISFYESRNKLVKVDATGTIDDNFNNIEEALFND